MIDTTIVGLVFGFGLIALARAHKPPLRGLYTFFAGIVWVFISVTIFPEYDAAWMVVTLALGIFLIFEGALEVNEVL